MWSMAVFKLTCLYFQLIYFYSDLYGCSDLEKVRMDMINDHVEDIRGEYARLIYHNYVSNTTNQQYMHLTQSWSK